MNTQAQAFQSMNAATPTSPAFIVRSYNGGDVIRLGTNEEVTTFRAQKKHLCLCKAMRLSDGWIDSYNGPGVSSNAC